MGVHTQTYGRVLEHQPRWDEIVSILAGVRVVLGLAATWLHLHMMIRLQGTYTVNK